MPVKLRQLSRLAKPFGHLAGVLVIMLALSLVVVWQAGRWLERHPAALVNWLAQKSGQTVALDKVNVEWTARGPLLRLSGLQLGSDNDRLPIGEAELMLALYQGWLPGRRLTELRLQRMALSLAREADGRWRVKGLPEAGEGDVWERLDALGELQLLDARVALDNGTGPALHIPHVDLRLQVDGNDVRAGVQAWLDEKSVPIRGSLRLQRDSGEGVLYLGARRLDLDGWQRILNLHGVALGRGRGRAEFWLYLQAHKVAGLDAVLDLREVELRSLAPPPGSLSMLRLERLRQRLHWRLAGNKGWLTIPEWHWQQQGQSVDLSGIKAGWQAGHWQAQAPRLALAPLLAVAGLSDLPDTSLRHWIGRARPVGQLNALHVEGQGRELRRLHGQAEGLGFAAVGDAPGLSGLSGQLEADGEGLKLDLDPRAAMVFDWPRGFRVKHPITATGQIAGWREGAGWRFGTAHLAVQGVGYQVNARGGMWFQNDGSRPWIDIAAQIGETRVSEARKFWIHHLMPKAAVDWLNAALVAGEVKNARGLVSGDLDDWPFDGHNGRFEARADIENGQLRFQPDWPAITDANLHAAFIADGMQVNGRGRLGDVQVKEINARIARFGQAMLEIDADGQGDAVDFLAVLKESPLRAEAASAFERIEAGGPASTRFSLRQALSATDARPAIRGTVALQGLVIKDKTTALVFENAQGEVVYDNYGFHADALNVLHRGQSGRLRLRTGQGHVNDPQQQLEAELVARLTPDTLLAQADQLDWLRPYLSGQSDWRVHVALPRGSDLAQARPSKVHLESDLRGTAIALPAPFDKPAEASWPLRLDLPLPLQEGELRLQLDSRLALRAIERNGRLGIRATLGSREPRGSLPANGVHINGRADRVDGIGWAGFAAALSGKGESFGNTQVNIESTRLDLLGQTFDGVRLALAQNANQTQIQLAGAQLRGRIELAHADNTPVRARMDWLDLRFGKSAAARPSSSAAPVDRDTSWRPQQIPALDIRVAELRLNGRALGALDLQTRPASNALQLERLHLQAPGQQLHATGVWSGQDRQARTRLDLQVESENLGELSERLGISGQIRQGRGQTQWQLHWPGSPMDFSPAQLSGQMRLTVHEGQLSALEPGAGRVLGLLSVARLPQRLALDFRDFFDKGFAFDQIDGQFSVVQGKVRAESFHIEGPAARIEVHGETDLGTQTFDQRIEVKPNTGNLLPVAGALAGGPAGAAVGALANAILKKPLSEVGARSYRVRGHWDSPQVEVLTRRAAREMAQSEPRHVPAEQVQDADP